MSYQVTVKQLVDFVQSFLPPNEALVIFKEAYAKLGVPLDLNVIVSEQDRQIAEGIVRDSVGVIDKSSVANLIGSFVEQGTLHIRDVLRIIDGARVFFEFMQELVQSSIEHISQGISVVDQQMRMVAWNRRYLEFFDYPKDYVRIGRPVSDLIRFNLERSGCATADLDAEVEKRVNYLKLGQTHNFERYRPEGRVLEVSGNPMPGGGFVTSYTDITSHKELEYKLRKANETLEQRVQERTKALEEANFSKSRFLAATSHDLMQPLNAAGLFASALSEKIHDPSLKELTTNITSSLLAANDLLNSLLEVSRIDSGAIRPKLQNFAIDELLTALALDFSALAENRGIKFKKIPSSRIIFSDKQLLRRILQNFLSNAIRYTDQDGRVLLGCRIKRGICRIEVWDTGIGVPEDKRAEIFLEFRRLRSPQMDAEEGLGLGLAIADRLSRLLNHRINLQSRVGRGSVFSVDVPLSVHSDIQEDVQPAKQAPLGNLAGQKILCIDNDKAVLEAMCTLLQGWGCKVLAASDLATAYQSIRQGGEPDAMLLDYQLDDGETGIQVFNTLNKGRNNKCPAIIITANNTEDVRAEAEEAGCLFLPKPVRPASLRAAITSLLVS
jgi:PAS domain S-box-containing protein